MKIHHVGIACLNIEEAIEDFAKYHTIVKRSEVVYDALQNASLCLVHSDMGLGVEFVAGEQVARMIKKGISYYHLCYEVENLDATISECVSNGAMIVSEPKPAVLFGNRRVSFLYLPYGLVEFLEK